MYTVLVIGSAGSGKTTFSLNFYDHLSRDNPILINFDPSTVSQNEYTYDIREYISTQEVMEECNMGPNGSILIAIKEMVREINLITNELKNNFVLIDMPGQIEIYLHCSSFVRLMNHFKSLGQLVIVSMFDGFNFLCPEKFLASCLNMVIVTARIEAPVVCLVSKGDLLLRQQSKDDKSEDEDSDEKCTSSEETGNIRKSRFHENHGIGMNDTMDSHDSIIDILEMIDGSIINFPAYMFKTPLQNSFYDFLLMNDLCTFKLIDYKDLDEIVYEIKTGLCYYDDAEVK